MLDLRDNRILEAPMLWNEGLCCAIVLYRALPIPRAIGILLPLFDGFVEPLQAASDAICFLEVKEDPDELRPTVRRIVFEELHGPGAGLRVDAFLCHVGDPFSSGDSDVRLGVGTRE